MPFCWMISHKTAIEMTSGPVQRQKAEREEVGVRGKNKGKTGRIEDRTLWKIKQQDGREMGEIECHYVGTTK